jgi:phosphohistidine swiveling domain-containing protein
VVSLIEKAEIWGTATFSKAARLAFVATDLIKSLAKAEIVPTTMLQSITQQSDSISARLVSDFRTLSREDFLREHGHVRPGSYDITVPRYDSVEARYFEWPNPPQMPPSSNSDDETILLTYDRERRVDEVLRSLGYEFSWAQFEDFAKTSIQAREYVKHLFSHLVSNALEGIADYGANIGISRENLSFLTVADIVRQLQIGNSDGLLLSSAFKSNRKAWELTAQVRLPDIITEPDDVFGFFKTASKPTFVTEAAAAGATTTIDSSELLGSIVFIENADPGYDWIFTRGVAGFVTKFGGENSHMAIRARELGIAAVIGAGEDFEEWRRAQRIAIDGASRRVQKIA